MPISVGSQLGSSAGEFAVLCMAGGMGLYLWGWRALRRRWMMAAMPTSKARSVAMGLAELRGKAKPLSLPAKQSPIRKVDCVWSRVVVKKHVQSGKNHRVSVVLDREVRDQFILEDDTGRVMVLPAGAELHGVETTSYTLSAGGKPPDDIAAFCDMNGIPWRGGFYGSTRYEIHEYVIFADADVYVLGEAGRLSSLTDATRGNVLARLKAILKDPGRKAEVDQNKDGIIQQEEWDAAKRRVEEEALKEEMAKGAAEPAVPNVVMRKPRMGYFIICSGDETEACKRQGHPGVLMGSGLGVAALGIFLAPEGIWSNPVAWISGGAMLLGTFAGPLFRMGFRK